MLEVVEIKEFGILKIVSLESAAAAASLDLRPVAGKKYKVLDAWGYHDDPVSRAGNWQFYDGTTTITKKSQTMPQNENHSLMRNDAVTPANEVYLTYDCYAQLAVGSLAAGKKIYINALVLEYGT